MALHILRQPSFGERAGTAFGEGLTSGLNALVDYKLNEMLQNRQRSRLKSAYAQAGLGGLEDLPSPLAIELLRQRGKQGETERFGQALALLSGASPEQISPISNETPIEQLRKAEAEYPQQVPVQFTTPEILQAAGISNLIPPQFQALFPQLTSTQLPQTSSKEITPQQIEKFSESPRPTEAPITLKTITPQDVARIAKQTNLSPRQYQELNRIAQENQKLNLTNRKQQFLEEKELRREKAVEQKEINKETKAYYDKLLEEDKAAKEADLTLKKMSKLVDNGKLPPASLYNFVNKLEDIPSTHAAAAGGAIGGLAGGPLGALVGGSLGALVSPVAALVKTGINHAYPDAEEFNKLSSSFIRGAKAVFGARITDRDLQAFLAQIPTLSQTDAGKKKIIKNMELFNEAIHVRTDVLKKIIKSNKGKRPENLQILVEDEAQPKLDKIASDFITG